MRLVLVAILATLILSIASASPLSMLISAKPMNVGFVPVASTTKSETVVITTEKVYELTMAGRWLELPRAIVSDFLEALDLKEPLNPLKFVAYLHAFALTPRGLVELPLKVGARATSIKLLNGSSVTLLNGLNSSRFSLLVKLPPTVPRCVSSSLSELGLASLSYVAYVINVSVNPLRDALTREIVSALARIAKVRGLSVEIDIKPLSLCLYLAYVPRVPNFYLLKQLARFDNPTTFHPSDLWGVTPIERAVFKLSDLQRVVSLPIEPQRVKVLRIEARRGDVGGSNYGEYLLLSLGGPSWIGKDEARAIQVLVRPATVKALPIPVEISARISIAPLNTRRVATVIGATPITTIKVRNLLTYLTNASLSPVPTLRESMCVARIGVNLAVMDLRTLRVLKSLAVFNYSYYIDPNKINVVSVPTLVGYDAIVSALREIPKNAILAAIYDVRVANCGKHFEISIDRVSALYLKPPSDLDKLVNVVDTRVYLLTTRRTSERLYSDPVTSTQAKVRGDSVEIDVGARVKELHAVISIPIPMGTILVVNHSDVGIPLSISRGSDSIEKPVNVAIRFGGIAFAEASLMPSQTKRVILRVPLSLLAYELGVQPAIPIDIEISKSFRGAVSIYLRLEKSFIEIPARVTRLQCTIVRGVERYLGYTFSSFETDTPQLSRLEIAYLGAPAHGYSADYSTILPSSITIFFDSTQNSLVGDVSHLHINVYVGGVGDLATLKEIDIEFGKTSNIAPEHCDLVRVHPGGQYIIKKLAKIMSAATSAYSLTSEAFAAAGIQWLSSATSSLSTLLQVAISIAKHATSVSYACRNDEVIIRGPAIGFIGFVHVEESFLIIPSASGKPLYEPMNIRFVAENNVVGRIEDEVAYRLPIPYYGG